MASLPRALLVIAVRFSLSDMDILQWLGAHIILSFIGSSVRLEPGSFLLVFLEKTRNCFRWNPFVLNFHYEMEAEMLRLIQYFLLLLFYDSRHSGFSIVWGSILLNIFLQYCYGRNVGGTYYLHILFYAFILFIIIYFYICTYGMTDFYHIFLNPALKKYSYNSKIIIACMKVLI